MDGQLTRTNCDEVGDYIVPNVLSPRDLVSRPDNVDETVSSSWLPCMALSIIRQALALHSLTTRVGKI